MGHSNKEKNIFKPPFYPGGKKALSLFIQKHLNYPPEAIQNKIEGTVVLKIDINHLGKIVKAEKLSGIGHGCDKEAIRLAKLLKYKTPKTRGIKVLFHKQLNIHFKLPRKSPAPSIQYEYKADPNHKKAYHYRIDRND